MTRSIQSLVRRGGAVARRLQSTLSTVLLVAFSSALGSSALASNNGPRSGATGCSDSRSIQRSATMASAHVTLRLNIPAFRLDVLSRDVVVKSHVVAVGAPRSATPVGQFDIVRVVWNPWWNAAASEWSPDERGTPPGSGNPLGRVLILARGPAYLHGSPPRATLGQARTDGGVAMRNESAIDIAQLVQACGGVSMPLATADSLSEVLRETRVIDLPHAVSLSIVYELVEVGAQTLTVYPDVYGRAPGSLSAEALVALARAGRDTTRVDRSQLDALLARASTRSSSIALEKLLR